MPQKKIAMHSILWFVGLCFGGAAMGAELTPIPEIDVPSIRTMRDALAKGDSERALQLLRAELAHSKSPGVVAALRILEGRVLARLSRGEEATEAFVKVLNDSTWGASALTEAHAVWTSVGNFDRAEAILEQAPEALRPQVVGLRSSGLFQQGEWDSASSVLTESLPSESGPDNLTMLAANLAFARGQADEAQRLFERLIESSGDPKLRAEAHQGLAQLGRARGAQAIRLQEDQAAIEVASTAPAHFDAGDAARILGRLDEARRHFESAAQLDPRLRTLVNLALSSIDEKAGKLEAARDRLVASFEGNANDALIAERLQSLLGKMGRTRDREKLPDDSRSTYVRLAAESDESMRQFLSTLLEGGLDYSLVAQDRRRVAAASSRTVALAWAHVLGGNDPSAIAWTSDAGEGDVELLELRALALSRTGNRSDALATLRKGLQGNVGASFQESYLRLLGPDDDEEFTRVESLLVSSSPKDPRLRIRLARLQETRGRESRALELLREAKELGGLTEREKRSLRDRIADLDSIVEESDGKGGGSGSSRK